MAEVTYEGPADKADPSTVFQTSDGTQLPVGVKKDVDAEVAKEVSGYEGHNFTVDGKSTRGTVTKADLRAQVEERGLDVPASANKDELAAALAEADGEASA